MEYFDLYAVFTTALLLAKEEELPAISATFSERATLNKLGKSNALSIGGRGKDGKPLPLSEWVKALRQEGITRCQWVYQPYIEDYTLEITTRTGHYRYKPDQVHQTLHKLNGQQLVELVDAQQNPSSIWQGLLDKYNKTLQRRSLPPVTLPALKAFFENKDLYRYHISTGINNKDRELSDAWQEVQLLCMIQKVPLQIPAAYQSLFIKPEGEPVTVVDKQVHLYPLQTLTGEELLELVNAQPFAADIWKQLPRQMKYYPELPQPGKTSTGPAFITSLEDADDLKGLGMMLSGMIATTSARKEVPPVIPVSLINKMGPDEDELIRLRAMAQVNAYYYDLASTPSQWESYFFEEISTRDWVEQMMYEHFTPLTTGINIQQAKTNFEHALDEAITLDPPFKNTFALARFFLDDRFPAGNFDKTHWKTIRQQAELAGFSKSQIQKATSSFAFSAEAQVLPWTPHIRRYMFAYEVTEAAEQLSTTNAARNIFRAAILSGE